MVKPGSTRGCAGSGAAPQNSSAAMPSIATARLRFGVRRMLDPPWLRQPSEADGAAQKRERFAEQVERETDASSADFRGAAQSDPRLHLAAGEGCAHQVDELSVRARYRFIA